MSLIRPPLLEGSSNFLSEEIKCVYTHVWLLQRGTLRAVVLVCDSLIEPEFYHAGPKSGAARLISVTFQLAPQEADST